MIRPLFFLVLLLPSTALSPPPLPPSTIPHYDLLCTATTAAFAAGSIILSPPSNSIKATKFNRKDLLTDTDPLCELRIKEIISSSHPTHSILGEESVAPGAVASAAALAEALERKPEYIWIVDPLDGTTNFVSGLPMVAPSVACLENGVIVAAAVYDPNRNEMFASTRGGGAWLNDGVIRTADVGDLDDLVLAMGAPPDPVSMEKSVLGARALMPLTRTTRMLGSAALMLAYVGCGRLGCYWEWDLSSWDVAAGALIVEEAGGIVGDLTKGDVDGFDIRTRRIIASCGGKIHGEVRRVLGECGVY